MRFIVAKAQRRFEQRQRLLIDRFCQRAWRFFIARAIAKGDLPAAKDYDRISWQTPKSLTVDASREAMQAREDYKAGLSTLSDYFGELGLDWQEQVDQRKQEQVYVSGGVSVQGDPLITKIGVGGAQALTAILQGIGTGQIDREQARVILVSVFGLNTDDAEKITSNAPVVDPSKNLPDLTTPTLGQAQEPPSDSAKLATPASASETPAELEAEIKLLKKISQPSETFTMKDDPDFQLSEKELNMVAKAVGFKNKPVKKKKA
jgi:hypothetical protein